MSEQLPSVLVREGLEGPERRLLDVRAFSSDDTRNVALFDVATDGKLVAYGVREGGADETEVRIRDVDTGQDLPDHLHTGAHYAVILLPDGQGFLYTLRTDAGTRVYEHRMGTNPASDVLVFGEGYPDTILIWLSASEDRRYWIATVSQGAGNNSPHDLYLADRAHGPAFRPLVTGLGAPLWTTWAEHRLFVRTNWKAPQWRVLEIDLAGASPDRWREVIPEGKSPLESLSVAGGKLVITRLENVTSRLQLYEPSGTFVRDIPLPTLGSAYGTGRWDRDELFFGFESFTTPWGIYRYVPSTGEQ